MKRKLPPIRIEEEKTEAGGGARGSSGRVSTWQRDLALVAQMRRHRDAPVDSMGCAHLADPTAPPKVYRFQVLLSLMLSSQTRDEVNAAAMGRLKEYGCNPQAMIDCPPSKLEQLLYPVSFYKRKTEYIRKAALIVKEKYEEDIPNSVDELCALPGVGPKMAHLIMQIAWGQIVGISVDTHVHRISNRLGWISTKGPEQSRIALEKLLPKGELWHTVNTDLVGFGQQICQPVRPKCDVCLLKNYCPSSTCKSFSDVF